MAMRCCRVPNRRAQRRQSRVRLRTPNKLAGSDRGQDSSPMCSPPRVTNPSPQDVLHQLVASVGRAGTALAPAVLRCADAPPSFSQAVTTSASRNARRSGAFGAAADAGPPGLRQGGLNQPGRRCQPGSTVSSLMVNLLSRPRAGARSGSCVGGCFTLTAGQATVCAEAYPAALRVMPAAARYGALAERRLRRECAHFVEITPCTRSESQIRAGSAIVVPAPRPTHWGPGPPFRIQPFG